MTYRKLLLGVLGTAASLAAVPAAASAAVTATLNQACYTHIPTQGSDPIIATLAGGTPGAGFVVAATVPGKGTGSAGSASGTFDAAGNATAQITNVSPPSGTIGPTKGQTVTLSIQDFGAPGGPVETPIGSALITNLALSVASRPSSPRAHRTVSVSGTPFAGQQMYGFVVKGTSRHVLRRISLGRANACGFVSDKEIVAPASYAPGTYRLYINAGRTLDKAKAIGSKFRITRRIL
jgi:hypothetical protein